MEFEKIKITDIVPAEYNPRLISADEQLKLRNSLDKFGMVDPIVVNLSNNHIIGGHQRFDVLLDKYMEDGFDNTDLYLIRLGKIGWVFTDTDLDVGDVNHEKALNLALNKISGDWDYGKLETVLTDLSGTGLDLDLTGFDNIELESLLDSDADFDDLFADDDDDDVDDEPSDMVDVDGEKPNVRYVCMISIDKLEDAQEFCEYLGVDDNFTGTNKQINFEDIVFKD